MRDISSELAAHLVLPVTTLCIMWKIKLSNGTVLGFTSHTSTLSYNDGSGDGTISYKASTGISPSNTKESVGTGVDNMDVIGILDSPDITSSDLYSGLYDNAKIVIMFANYKDLSMGHGVLMSGRIGEIHVKKNMFMAEVRSLSQLVQQQIGRVCTPTCMVKEFCDSECGLNAATYTYTGTVTSVTNRRIIFASAMSGHAANSFSLGKLTFTSGLNNNRKQDVKYNDNVGGNGRFEFQEAFPFDVQVGDTFSVIKGCDRRPQTCISFGNFVNYRGFPHIPGVDATLAIIRAGDTDPHYGGGWS